MEILGKNKASDGANGQSLYRALACGDLPAAYIICNDVKDKSDAATAFNCGLCLYLLGEWEKALTELTHAEQSLGSKPEYDVSERRLFVTAIETSGERTAFLPLDPDMPDKCGRYALIRVRWLTAHCLIKLGRQNEAATVGRFLAQYGINI